MRTIDEDIKSGQFKTVYLLYGDEAYLKKQYKDKLVKALVAEGDTMNFSAYEGKGINTKEINPKTMESKIIKGLYFAGEIIDVDSYTGGFNLQIAYSTGYTAGINV